MALRKKKNMKGVENIKGSADPRRVRAGTTTG
jgi:hypothetical protein